MVCILHTRLCFSPLTPQRLIFFFFNMDLPPIYSFPPLYTKQPNKLIRNKQIETWINIIITNAQSLKLWEINKIGTFIPTDTERMSSDSTTTGKNINESIFQNNAINRSVPQLFINDIWKVMLQNNQIIVKNRKTSNGNNTSSSNSNNNKVPLNVVDDADDIEFYILWKPLESWATEILEWFESMGQLNKVVTFYELSQGDEFKNCSFHSMPQPLLFRCLKILVKRGRATMLKGDSNENIELDNFVAIKVV